MLYFGPPFFAFAFFFLVCVFLFGAWQRPHTGHKTEDTEYREQDRRQKTKRQTDEKKESKNEKKRGAKV